MTGILLFLSLASGQAVAQNSGLTLKQAVEGALDASHGVKSADAARDAAKAAASQAGHMRLPILSYDSAFTRGNDPVYVFGTLLRQKQFTASDFDLNRLNSPDARSNFSNSLQLELPLFTGFRISHYQKLSDTAVRQADSMAIYARQGTAMEVVQKYLLSALKAQLAAIASDAVASSGAELAVADRLKEKGLVLGSDYYAAQSLLGSMKAAASSFSKEAAASAASLSVLMGLPANRAAVPAPLARHEYLLPEEASLLDSLTGRGDVAAAELGVRSARIVRDMESDSLWPQLGAFARVQTDTRSFFSNPIREMAGVGLSFPLGDFTRSDRVARREAEHRQAGEAAQQLKQNAAAQLAEYRRNYESALDALPLAEGARADAERSLELFRPLFRQGRQSVLDVARAEYALMSARASCAELVFKIHSYYAALLFASGRLGASAVEELSIAVSGGKDESARK
ncbi:MAG TPA: TolC family protein [Elusimicrobiales bacterium]|nr:TolC family protein [Elusimicrobiales bacterium]